MDPRPGLPDLAAMRAEYTAVGLDEHDVAKDWFSQFTAWMGQAVASGIAEPNAMVLATVNAHGEPSARTVLAKGVDVRGVVLYTNYESAKSADLDTHPVAAVTFPWYALQRQIHLRGPVSKVSAEETAAYWAMRPRNSQLGAWASPQSSVVADRATLDQLQDEMKQRFAGPDGEGPVPVPPHWGGWRVSPVTVEFWQGRRGRMHDRVRYRRADLADGRWIIERLAP